MNNIRFMIKWDKKERQKVETRIIALRDDQVAALLNLVGLNFFGDAIREAISELRKHGHDSAHLDMLMMESDSKANLVWWVDYFTENNSSNTGSQHH